MIDESHSKIQWPRNISSVVDDYTGLPGEIMLDSERQEIRVHDGAKRGGWRFVSLEQLRRLFISADSELGKVKYADDVRGFLTRIGKKTWGIRQLVPGDGISIDNPTGESGNVTIAVEGRLAATAPSLVTNLDNAIESGFYIIAAAAANRPGSLAAGNASLHVIAGKSEAADSLVIQRVVSIATTNNTVFTRRFITGAWTSWS